MSTVTGRIKEIKQPRGGYLPLRDFTTKDMDALGEITSPENIHPSTVGTAVDYLTRLITGSSPSEAFDISLLGARLIGEETTAHRLLSRLNGLTDDSIRAACQLSGFDVVYRAGPVWYKPVDQINPDGGTIKNIRIMTERMGLLFETNPPTLKEFDFTGAYTDLIHIGDGDILTADTLWDIKVSKTKPQPKNTLQILIYWIMGCRSVHPQFQTIEKLGIVNPRLGKTWTISVETIPDTTLTQVSTDVIGYADV